MSGTSADTKKPLTNDDAMLSEHTTGDYKYGFVTDIEADSALLG